MLAGPLHMVFVDLFMLLTHCQPRWEGLPAGIYCAPTDDGTVTAGTAGAPAMTLAKTPPHTM